MLYLLRSGCQCRALPSDFPNWRALHSYFAKWSQIDERGVSLLEQALKNQVVAPRLRLERSACSTLLIVDAQGVKNTDTAELKGYDVGKKVSGIERQIMVDTQGQRRAVAIATAEVTDRKGAPEAPKLSEPTLRRVQSLLVSCPADT